MTTRTCRRCGKPKPESNFYRVSKADKASRLRLGERIEPAETLLERIDALKTELDRAKKDRDRMMMELDGFQCDIASAFGWDMKGETFVASIRRVIAENKRLKEELQTSRDLAELIRRSETALRAELKAVGAAGGKAGRE